MPFFFEVVATRLEKGLKPGTKGLKTQASLTLEKCSNVCVEKSLLHPSIVCHDLSETFLTVIPCF